ncbi:hypothetical protein N7E70_021065 [Aminobacter sp. NyZ550]|uniref:Uncharacterized protein n=1 Tax=Aminobacter ciceronei TaxID=150723 RepID=A0ABR6C2K6_9HYPH|nr:MULTISPECIES: hypothetical protein [Aminobacter]MBA8905496.1 hypothetical protein [Aminobacter ciceronei]MBA9019205.1 hypothetical protein [Aminobacter ciceronei]WAX94144.1 hypothetical protein N7E70_021065 [Aminobacter sp. NyZ550]
MDAFEELAILVSTGRTPLPVARIERLVVEATAPVAAEPDIASATEEFLAAVGFLDLTMEMNQTDDPHLRREVLDILAALKSASAAAARQQRSLPCPPPRTTLRPLGAMDASHGACRLPSFLQRCGRSPRNSKPV